MLATAVASLARIILPQRDLSKFLTFATFKARLLWHQLWSRLTCWARWTFRWWPAQTAPWWWGSEIQTPRSLFLWTWGCPQCTAWNVAVKRETGGVSVRSCMCVLRPGLMGLCSDWVGVGGSCQTLASFQLCMQSIHRNLNSLSMPVCCWDHQTLLHQIAANEKDAQRRGKQYNRKHTAHVLLGQEKLFYNSPADRKTLVGPPHQTGTTMWLHSLCPDPHILQDNTDIHLYLYTQTRDAVSYLWDKTRYW